MGPLNRGNPKPPFLSDQHRKFVINTGKSWQRRYGSLSIDLNFDHEPRELLSSARSHETSLPSLPTSLTVNCGLLATDLQWRFSAPLDQRSPQSPRSTVRWAGGGRAARGVSSWSLFRYLCFSVAAWRKEAPDGDDFGYFGLDSCPRAHPAGQHGPCAEVGKAAGLTFSRLHFGLRWFRASRLAGVCRSSGGKSRFFWHSTCAFGSFFNSAF